MSVAVLCDRCGKGPLGFENAKVVKIFEISMNQPMGGNLVRSLYACDECVGEILIDEARARDARPDTSQIAPEPVSTPVPAEAATEVGVEPPAPENEPA